jgi:hypothetical protein
MYAWKVWFVIVIFHNHHHKPQWKQKCIIHRGLLHHHGWLSLSLFLGLPAFHILGGKYSLVKLVMCVFLLVATCIYNLHLLKFCIFNYSCISLTLCV